MKIDVVIPNYNGADLIKKNLSDVIKSFDGNKEISIIIVDDCSEEGDYKKLRASVDLLNISTKVPVTLIRKDKNEGFSSTVNQGVEKSKAELVLLLNSDAVPLKGFLDSPLEEFSNNSNLFGIGLMDISIEGDKKVKRGRGLAYWKKGMLRHKRGDVNKTDTFWISGGSSIVRRELFEKIGGFDSLFNPFYWEDIDLSYRAVKSGYDILFDNRSMVEHRHDEGSIKKHFSSDRVTSIAYKNQFIFHWKNITDTSFIVSHLFWLPFHLLNAIIRGDNNFIKGFFLAVNKLPDIMRHRKLQKATYAKRDSEII